MTSPQALNSSRKRGSAKYEGRFFTQMRDVGPTTGAAAGAEAEEEEVLGVVEEGMVGGGAEGSGRVPSRFELRETTGITASDLNYAQLHTSTLPSTLALIPGANRFGCSGSDATAASSRSTATPTAATGTTRCRTTSTAHRA